MSTSEEATPDHEKTLIKQAEGINRAPGPGSKTKRGLRAKVEDGQHAIRTGEQVANSGTDAESSKQITVDPDKAKVYGTTRLEYKLWVDYIFDWFGATLETRFRHYLVAIGFGTTVWGIGLVLSFIIGFAYDYLTTPAVYYFWFISALCAHWLRWLSQVYHERTNAVRPCFPIDDAEYKRIVSPFARNAVRNKRIFVRGTLVTLLLLSYFGAIMFGYIRPLSPLASGFPSSFPVYWLTGNFKLVKLAIISLFFGVCGIGGYTGAHLTRSTAPLYAKLATLCVLPLPSLVTELFQGVLNLYLTGAFMWSSGIVIVEFLYQTRANALGISLLILSVLLGVFAYLAPLEAVRRIWRKAKSKAVIDAVRDFYTGNTSHNADELKRLNEYIQSLSDSEPARFNIVQLFNVILPVIPLIANTFLSGYNLFESIFGK